LVQRLKLRPSGRDRQRPDIVHVLPHAHPLGGTERTVLDLLESEFLADLEQRVVFLRGGPLGPFSRECALGVNDAATPNVARAAKVVLRSRPRILHGWLLRGNTFVAWIGTALPRTTLLTSERNLGHNLTPVKRLVERFVAAREDLCVVNSHAVARAAASRLPTRRQRIRVIWPGIRVPDQVDRRRRFSCVAVGRLEPVKDHETLLRAWPLVLARHPHATLAIVGEGSERRSLERIVSDLGIGHSISLVGAVDPLPLLRGCDVYVSTSRAEGFSRALLEALALGVPIVTTAVGGVDELPADAVQRVPVGDVDGAAGAIGLLLVAPGIRGRLAAAGRAVYEKSFTLEHCHSAYRDLYLALLRRGG
jgi:glycosyltransferase involved in cell wall biosynthesis